MTKAKCLICNGSTADSNAGYHASCCKELFGQPTAPDLPYAYSELNELAKKIVRSRITVPGVQAKLSLHLDSSLKKPGRFTIVGLWGNYILKPPMDAYPYMPEIENLTMCLANFFGIATVSHGLIRLKSGELAYITRRIDRLPNGGKLHMEDMCQLNERLTEDKYKGSMEQIGKIVKKYSSNPLLDCIRLFEVTLFSFLTGNADMHLKNFSLIYPVNGMVQLSPAYDLIASRLLISEKDDPEEMALTLNGKKRRIVSGDFKKFAENLGLNEIQLGNIMKRFAKKMHTIESLLENTLLPDEKAHDFIALMTERALRVKLI